MLGRLVTVLAAVLAGVGAATAFAGARPAAPVPTITVTMHEFAFRLSRGELPAGKVRFVFVNGGGIQHDFVLLGRHGVRSRLLPPLGRQSAVFTLPKGTFRFICDVPGHAQLGMRGVLHVGRARASSKGVTPPPPAAQPPPPASTELRLTPVAKGLDRPDLVTSQPGSANELYVVEQEGTIRRIADGVVQPQPFLDLRELVHAESETGLLSMAFAPDFASSGLFYVDYNDQEGNHNLNVVQYRVYPSNRALADPGSAREILHIVKPWENHNGGMMQFGPDGHLYISVGDGDSGVLHPPGAFAQTLDDLLGNILRIDPNSSPDGPPYTVPAENPFVDVPGDRPEVWAYGLRNPWRFWIDPPTGAMVIGDVGLGDREELDVVGGGQLAAGGFNFGWPCWEGTLRRDTAQTCTGAVPPAYDYGHDEGRCSVIGGVVVRDPSLPALAGRYVFADFCAGQIMSAALGADGTLGTPEPTGLSAQAPTSFGVDGAGHVYVTTLGGAVYRIDPAS